MNNKERLEYISEKILASSKTELYMSMRFLDKALSNLNYKIYLKTNSIGTDAVNILYNPSYLIKHFQNDVKVINRVYLHMILHCLFKHMMTDIEEEDLSLWDLSCDICVESIIDSLEYRCIKGMISPVREECYEKLYKKHKVLTAQNIYTTLKSEVLSIDKYIMLQREFIKDDHSIWEVLRSNRKNQNPPNNTPENIDDSKLNSNENDNNDENENNSNKVADARNLTDEELEKLKNQWEDACDRMETEIETFGKEKGHGDEVFCKHIKVVYNKRDRYSDYLKLLMIEKEEMKIDIDSFDYGFYMYGLSHYNNVLLIEENEFKEARKIENLIFVIDTSKSISDDLVRRFINDTFGIMANEDIIFSKFNIHIIEADEEVRADRIIHNREELDSYCDSFEVYGGCKTDFRPAFEYIDNLEDVNLIKGVIYFTDGFGEYPKKCPNYNVAFVFSEEDVYDDSKVPIWADKLFL